MRDEARNNTSLRVPRTCYWIAQEHLTGGNGGKYPSSTAEPSTDEHTLHGWVCRQQAAHTTSRVWHEDGDAGMSAERTAQLETLPDWEWRGAVEALEKVLTRDALARVLAETSPSELGDTVLPNGKTLQYVLAHGGKTLASALSAHAEATDIKRVYSALARHVWRSLLVLQATHAAWAARLIELEARSPPLGHSAST